MNELVGLLIPLAGIAMIFGIVYLGVTSDTRRDMAMIEAGMNPKEKKNDKDRTLKNALLLIFIPLGYFIGNYFKSQLGLSNSFAGIAFAFLFGGLGLLLFYFISNKKSDNNISA